MISCYKIHDTTKLSVIDININYELNSSCNKMINYNLYSVNKNITSKFIRNKIKNIRGYNPVETVRERILRQGIWVTQCNSNKPKSHSWAPVIRPATQNTHHLS